MKRKSVLILLMAMMVLSMVFAGCAKSTGDAEPAGDVTPLGDVESAGDKGIVVTDMLGREVTLKGTAQSAVAIGPGALRLYCYVADTAKLAGIEEIEVDNPIGRPYLMVNPSLNELPVIGQGGPNNAPDPEKLLTAGPDVIFSMYNSDAASVDELQQKTGIPVIALSYGATEAFDPALSESLTIIGQVMGATERAGEVVAFLEQCQADLNDRTKDIPDGDKPTVYLGAQSNKGTHGIESTSGNYSLFNAVNAINVLDLADIHQYVMIDKEQLLEWDPDVIIIDAGGFANVTEDYGTNPDFYEALSAFKNEWVYMQLPYNSYYTNIDIAIGNAYYIGTVLYPEQFADVDIAAKADEIFEALLGQPLYESLAQHYYGGYGPFTVGE